MYFLEGNQGVGKSTFLKLLNKNLPQIEIQLEPLENWQKKRHGQSLLKNFFDDISRWSYTIDTFTLMCRVKEHLINQQHTNLNRLLERSIYSGYYGYAMTGYKFGGMTEIEWQLYNEWFDYLTVNCKQPTGFIYLRAEPEVAFARACKRNRAEESSCTLNFFKMLGQMHDNFLIDRVDVKPEIKNIPVLILDCDKEFETDEKVLTGHLDKIQQFLLDTQVQILAKNTQINLSK